MLRISKLTDYGTVLLAHLAANPADVCSAADVASATGIALPTVSKLLKSLARAGLVTSTRGANGGYRLAAARSISVLPTSSTRSKARYRLPSAARLTACARMRASAASAAPGNASTSRFDAHSTMSP